MYTAVLLSGVIAGVEVRGAKATKILACWKIIFLLENIILPKIQHFGAGNEPFVQNLGTKMKF